MKKLLFILCLLLINQILYSAPSIIVEPGIERYPIGKNIEYYEDKKGTLEIGDVSSPTFNKNFIPSKVDALNFGFTKSIYWIKFDIISKFDVKEKMLLELDYPLMDQIKLFIPENNDKFIIKETGDIFPFNKREVTYRNFVFKVSIVPKEKQTYYMRFESESSMQFPLIMWAPTAFAQKINKEIYILGIYYGILLSMFLYNLFIFASVRETGYLFYVFYVVAFCLVQLCFNGLAFEYLWPNFPWWGNKSVPFLIGFAYFAALPFTRSYIKTKTNVPLLDKILIFLTGLSVLVMALSLVMTYATSIKLAVVFAILSSLFILVSGTACVLKKYRPAYFYMLAWTMFMVGVFLFALLHFGVLPLNFLTEYGMHLGSSMEVILLSFGLADRINTEKKEKYLAQKKSLENEKLARIAQQEAIENLHKADKLKDEFLANTSHEIRTPLNGIIGITDSIVKGATGPISDLTKKNLLMISVSSKRLASLVNDILDFSKLKNQDIELQLKPLDIQSSIDSAIVICRPLVGTKSIVINNNISDIPKVIADENRMEQVFLNLIGNAIKFTDSGSITITSEIFSDNGIEKLKINIEDTGIGIEEKNFNKIFESFQQEDGSTERNFGGTGLGLSISKKLIELHKGRIEVKSTPGQGSIFSVILPVQNSENEFITPTFQEKEKSIIDDSDNKFIIDEELDTELSEILEVSQISLTEMVQEISKDGEYINILAVDDDPINLQVISNQFSGKEFNIIKASTGKEAISILEKRMDINLVLLDVMMPGMSGYEVSKIIREKFNPTELPVILLTAKNQSEDLVVGFQAGANDYITKPFSSDEFISRVIFHLEHSFYSSKLKKTMAELEDLNINLEKKVEERTRELNNTLGELTTANDNLTIARNALWGEMELAKKIQTVLLPRNPEISNFEVIGYMSPADEVGGDYYDVINAEGINWVLIGDVSGHGIQSGLIMMMIQTCIRNTLQINPRIKPSTLLSVVNDTIYDNIQLVDKGKYMTITALAICPDGKIIFSGLHQDIIVCRAEKENVGKIGTDGIWIGLDKDIRKHLKNYSFKVNVGDTIMLFTDGIIESWIKNSVKDKRNPQREMYGQERLIKIFEKFSSEPLDYIKKEILEDLNEYDVSDDVTLVLLRRIS